VGVCQFPCEYRLSDSADGRFFLQRSAVWVMEAQCACLYTTTKTACSCPLSHCCMASSIEIHVSYRDSQTMTSSSRETDMMYDAGPMTIGDARARTLPTTQQSQVSLPSQSLHFTMLLQTQIIKRNDITWTTDTVSFFLHTCFLSFFCSF